MKGSDFVDALRNAVAPVAITGLKGEADGVTFTLSDGRLIKAERKRIAKLDTAEQAEAYLAILIG